MTRLSVNVNKVATLRNSRGGSVPSVLQAVQTCVAAGVRSITVHPREDQRHIRPDDVYGIAEALAPRRGRVELNMEGDPRVGFLQMVEQVRPDQCTLVPVRPGEITSEAGWPADTPSDALSDVIAHCHAAGARVSMFVGAAREPIEWAAALGADRVELYTEPYARAFEKGGEALTRSLDVYRRAAEHAHSLGLEVNAGHDLDLDNLPTFLELPHIAEVSIGHALISRALFVGLERVVSEYLAIEGID
jgi:pyridoxine 5-phosphate synthase